MLARCCRLLTDDVPMFQVGNRTTIAVDLKDNFGNMIPFDEATVLVDVTSQVKMA